MNPVDLSLSLVHKSMASAAGDVEFPFPPPTISKLFLPVASYSKCLKPQDEEGPEAGSDAARRSGQGVIPNVPLPGRAPASSGHGSPASPASLSERLRIAARRAWINYRRDPLCGYEMSQAILRECGGRREFTKPRWVAQQMRRGQALERLVHDGYVQPGMVLWFSNAPGADPNRLDPRCDHAFYTCIGMDERGLPEFAGTEGERLAFEVVAQRLRLAGCALDVAFPFSQLI